MIRRATTNPEHDERSGSLSSEGPGNTDVRPSQDDAYSVGYNAGFSIRPDDPEKDLRNRHERPHTVSLCRLLTGAGIVGQLPTLKTISVLSLKSVRVSPTDGRTDLGRSISRESSRTLSD
jgi:hypothetical protein